MDELKRFLPHVSGFPLPCDHRIELSKPAQNDAFLNRPQVAEMPPPQTVDGLSTQQPPLYV